MPAKPLTDQQLTEAAALKTLFKAWQQRRKGEGLPFSQDWASEQMRFGQSAMNQYLNGKIPLNPEAASKFAVLMGVNIESFSPAISDEIVVLAEGVDAIGRLDSNVSPGPEIRGRVPLVSWVQAGAWCKAEDLLPPGEAERWFDCPVNHSSSTFTLRVRGDSMTAPHGNTRTYPEGCFIFVDPEKRMPDNGDRVVACLEGSDEVTFKVYKNEDGRQWLQPLNPTHEPIREKFKVLGTVLGKWEDG